MGDDVVEALRSGPGLVVIAVLVLVLLLGGSGKGASRGSLAGMQIRTLAILALMKVTWRWWTGAHLDGVVRTDAGWITRGTVEQANLKVRVTRWAYQPRLVRVAVRVGCLIAPWVLLWAFVAHRTALIWIVVVATVVFVGYQVRVWRARGQSLRFRRMFVQPLAATVGPVLNLDPGSADKWLTVDPSLSELTPKLMEKMTPAEKKVREWYGEHLEPIVRWLPERSMRAWWKISPSFAWVILAYGMLTITEKKRAPGVEIRAGVWVPVEIRTQVNTMVSQKLGVGGLKPVWDSIGPATIARWHVEVQPPKNVSLADIMPYIDALKDDDSKFIIGLKANSEPAYLSLKLDSPHIACSAASGAGKSVFNMLLGIQVLRRGGRVIILDLKGSHRWARNLEGVTYCTTPAQMHKALLEAHALAEDRNRQAILEEDDWDAGPRVLIIFEEMNATVARIKSWWESVREKGDPKICPSIQAYRDGMFLGRSAKVNYSGVAQMLTANTTGGPEARENFGVRALARYTRNNWKMLADCAMPPASRHLGRWQIVVGGEATAVQVAYLSTADARALAAPPADVAVPTAPTAPAVSQMSQTSQEAPQEQSEQACPTPDVQDIDLTDLTPPDPLNELVTLQEASDAGLVEGKVPAIYKRLQRAVVEGDPNVPQVRGKRGNANLYRRGDLIEWGMAVKR